MPTTDISFEMLHVLKVKGLASPSAIAAMLDEDEATTTRRLADADAAQLVKELQGRVTGWTLTPEGRNRYEQLAESQGANEPPPSLVVLYAAFVGLNVRLKDACTRWQLEGQPIDCVRSIAEINAAVTAHLDAVSPTAPRFGTYRRRFDHALARLQAGDQSAMARPLSDSYHDVWMELHQDLLLTLRQQRSDADGH